MVVEQLYRYICINIQEAERLILVLSCLSSSNLA